VADFATRQRSLIYGPLCEWLYRYSASTPTVPGVDNMLAAMAAGARTASAAGRGTAAARSHSIMVAAGRAGRGRAPRLRLSIATERSVDNPHK
jgi:hypothetical protein